MVTFKLSRLEYTSFYKKSNEQLIITAFLHHSFVDKKISNKEKPSEIHLPYCYIQNIAVI